MKGNLQMNFILMYVHLIHLLPAFFETPLEEFELQLMHAESRLSQDSIVSPERPSCNITVRKGKKQHVTFEDQAEYTGYQSKDTVEMGSQTDAFPINL